MKTVKTHITQLLHAMNKGIFEKEHPIALSLLSAISGESIFFSVCSCMAFPAGRAAARGPASHAATRFRWCRPWCGTD